jgi:hypothetical protein
MIKGECEEASSGFLAVYDDMGYQVSVTKT